MSVAFIADLHLTNPKKFGGAKRLGVNERCKLILRTLERAYKIASGAGATSLFILGDFFDSGSPGPRIIAAGQAVIVEAQEKYGISTVIMPGNHDLFSSETGDHTLGPLRPVAQVVDGPTQVCVDGIQVNLVPYQPGPAKEWLSELQVFDRTSSDARHRVLALHVGIQTDSTQTYLKNDQTSIPVEMVHSLLDRWNCSWCISGHWHRGAELDSNVIQCGALCPTGWTDEGLKDYGSLWIFDAAKTNPIRHEISGPRFVRLRGEAALHESRTALKAAPAGTRVFLELELEREAKDRAIKEIEGFKSLENFAQARIVYDTKQATKKIREAAAAVCRASSMSEALAEYVRGIKISPPATHESVLEHARRLSGI